MHVVRFGQERIEDINHMIVMQHNLGWNLVEGSKNRVCGQGREGEGRQVLTRK